MKSRPLSFLAGSLVLVVFIQLVVVTLKSTMALSMASADLDANRWVDAAWHAEEAFLLAPFAPFVKNRALEIAKKSVTGAEGSVVDLRICLQVLANIDQGKMRKFSWTPWLLLFLLSAWLFLSMQALIKWLKRERGYLSYSAFSTLSFLLMLFYFYWS